MMRTTQHKHPACSGFTLVEMSIVLVIIGLIVGGVLIASHMLKNAEITAQIADIKKINQSINTFEIKYDCLPGDCATATNFFSAASQPQKVTNGNGNGTIRGHNSETTIDSNHSWCAFSYGASCEFMSVFDHLSAAGLWNAGQYDETTSSTENTHRPGIGYPQLKIRPSGKNYPHASYLPDIQGGVLVGYEPGASYNSGGHRIRLGACEYYVSGVGKGYTAFTCGISPMESYAIDVKIDDGKPMSGNMVVMEPGAYTYRIPGVALGQNNVYCRMGTGNDASVTTTNNVYRNDSNLSTVSGTVVKRTCAPSIKAEF